METARRRNGPPQPTAGFPSQTTRRRADARRRSRSSIVAWTSRHSRWSTLLVAGCAAAFAPRAAPPRHRPATQLNCICVNCAFVDNCTAYHVVEAKHGQPHGAEKPIFTPREGSPTVAVNIFPPDSVNKAKGFEIELDVVECADFAREMGKWRKMMPPGTLVKAGFDPDYEPP